jgi:hypothetical protein
VAVGIVGQCAPRRRQRDALVGGDHAFGGIEDGSGGDGALDAGDDVVAAWFGGPVHQAQGSGVRQGLCQVKVALRQLPGSGVQQGETGVSFCDSAGLSVLIRLPERPA